MLSETFGAAVVVALFFLTHAVWVVRRSAVVHFIIIYLGLGESRGFSVVTNVRSVVRISGQGWVLMS